LTLPVLQPTDLALAALLLLINAALSILFRLGLARAMLVAATRMVAQLLLIGLVLRTVFALVSPFWTAAVAVVMLGFAGYEVMARQDRRFAGLWGYGIGASTMTLAAVLVTALALTTQIRADPWYDPRFAIPLLGMILGNAMTGISLGIDTLTDTAARERPAIEAQLALGRGRADAFRGVAKRALRSGLMPIINSMSAVGLVFLPGMMTGQILAGVDPVEAVKYQLLIMFLIAGATGAGVLMAVFLGIARLTDNRHRLRLDRLKPARR